ncbi:glycosyltransferase [Agathobacter rectalis]|jgi:glycosyltransferase involved in cell wall biosynthesis|uniref:glycosyltransferase n=1 Tax=Agathobacter rectalis TaxID=39491 RepID=UPI003EDB2C5C
MRVVHVAECVGGVERYLRSLLKYSSCENIMILSQLYNKSEFEKIADKVEIINMNHNIGVSAIKEAIQVRKKIKNYNPDVVYAHSSIAGAITRMACIGLNIKVIYNPHGWSFNMESNKKNIFIVLEKIMSRFCDKIICISDAEKESALKYMICKQEKLHVIYNGIDINEYKSTKVDLPVSESTFVVGMVGRISKQKAPDIFVKMAGEVKKKIPDSCFVIVGDVIEGDEKERRDIEELAEKLDINLIITGWVDNPLTYMNRFNVGCLLSRWEGFGLVIPEYMLTKTPIVATKVDAIPYLIKNGVDGLLVDKDDWMVASKKVIEIAEDSKLKQKLIINGGKKVRQKFNAERVAKESEKLYEEIIE